MSRFLACSNALGVFLLAPNKVEEIASLPRSCIANGVIMVLLKNVTYSTGLIFEPWYAYTLFFQKRAKQKNVSG